MRLVMVELEKTGNSGHLFGGSLPRADCVFVEVSQLGEMEKEVCKDAEMAGVIHWPQGKLEKKEAARSSSVPVVAPPSLPAPSGLLGKLFSQNR